jgi:hypothetical protein
MGRKTKEPEVKSKPISTAEIEIAVAKMFNIRTHIIVPNISWGFHFGHEMDLFVLTKSNLVKEVEIKISVSDFRADFKKWHQHKSKYVKEFYYAFPKELYDKVKDEVPEHAGIIICDRYANGRIYARIVKNAKINSKCEKLSVDDQLKIERLGCMRIWSLKEKVLAQKKEIAELKSKIDVTKSKKNSYNCKKITDGST